MIRYLIKNNFKIMFRNGLNIFMYVLCPIIVSSVLISAFSSLMESYEPVQDFEVGYRVEENSDFAEYIDLLADAGSKNGISFVEYKTGTPKKLVDSLDLGGFIEFNNDGYTIYESEDKQYEGAKLEYMISAFFNKSISDENEDISLDIKYPEHAAAINSTDYYGIIYVVYFGWCAIVCAAGLFSQEKKNRINERLKVSNISAFKLYLAKIIPIVSVVSLGIGISSIITAFLFGVHWGNIGLSIIIVLFMVIAATTFEVMIYEITNSMIATIILSFGIVWIWGFVGGSFETYMFSGHSEMLKLLSPVYHGNRALVELSSIGKSDYILSSILYSLIMSIVCSFVAIMAGNIRRTE